MIAGIFSLLIGIIGIATGFFQLRNLTALGSWKTAAGKVIERGTFQITHATRSPPAFQYSPLVRYVYQLEGKEFVNDSIFPKHIQLPEHNSIEWATGRANSFPNDVTVYYNPENPSDSFLVHPSRKTFYMVIGLSFLPILVGLIFLLTK